ncbi:MAG: polysaccharide deacetylase family protein [Thermoleophilia bacterium]|nr:polysaccharide deacetylase family protein [Thermoleophilia bacterium]
MRRRISVMLVAVAVAGSPVVVPAVAKIAMPTAAAQQAAVARVAALGLPIYRAGDQGKYVALTFDDGPGPYTTKVLDELARYGFRATWFVNGKNLSQWGGTLSRQAREGAVGDHTWSHGYLPRMSVARQRSEVARSIAGVRRLTGKPVTLFRPPYGSATTELNVWLRNRGVLPVLWSADSADSLGAPKEAILATSKAGVVPGGIILLHENRGQTYWAVNRLLPYIRSQGFIAVTVPELLALNPPDLAAVRARAGSGIGFR